MLDVCEGVLKMFGDQNRLRIMFLLRQRKMCVCELAYVLQVTQPSVSRHLKKLKKAGIVKDEPDGFWTNYFLNERSDMGRTLLTCISAWLECDATLQADRRRLATAKRRELCRR